MNIPHYDSSPGRAQNRRYNRGRWQVERERFQIDDPFPPTPRHEPVRLGELIGAQVEQIMHTLASRQASGIADHWQTVTDAAIREQTRLGNFERGTLTVYVRSNTWLHELRRFHQQRIEAALRERMQDFKNIRFRLDPGDPPV